jgi:hypothetical protein
VYPYAINDRTPRSHDAYLKAAKEACRRSNGRKEVAVDGIKGYSSLCDVLEYPAQIVYDFMHLVCLGHVPSLISRWCTRLNKEAILGIDESLQRLRIPHNMKVVFLDSFKLASQWKAKNCRLFVMHVGVPLMIAHLPKLLLSHFVVYSLAIKLLYAPHVKEEILVGERLLEFYCRTAPHVHDSSVEILSLHAHIHLAQQVRQHGGLAHMSAFAFESAIRFIQRKVHGSIHLASQIAYWTNLRCTTPSKKFDLAQDILLNVSENKNFLEKER